MKPQKNPQNCKIEQKFLFSIRLTIINKEYINENGNNKELDNFLTYLRNNNLTFKGLKRIISNKKRDEDFYDYQRFIKPQIKKLISIGLLKK